MAVSCTFSTAIVTLWCAAVRPQPFDGVEIGLGLLTIAGCGFLATRPLVRTAFWHFLGLTLGTVWTCLFIGWMLVLPGHSFAPAALVFGGGALAGLVVVVLTVVRRFSAHRFDGLVALGLIAAAVTVTVTTWPEIPLAGIRLRLSLVQDRYERAIELGQVDEAGGFVEDDLSGWIWIDTILDPAAGVVHDPSDRLEDRTRVEPIGVMAFAEVMTCDRIKPHWYWCHFG